MPRKTVAQLDTEMQEFRSEILAGFGELKTLISQNGNGSAPSKSTRKATNAKRDGKQPFFNLTFVPKGGVLHQVLSSANDLKVGGRVEYNSARTFHDINHEWGQNRYDWGDYNKKTKTRLHTRKPDDPDKKTYDDGVSWIHHKAKSEKLPNGKYRYLDKFYLERAS